MMEAIWKKDESEGTKPAPTWSIYSEAMNKSRTSAEEFMAQVHLLNEARVAYQEALSTSIELRNRLDSGDEALRSVMAQLEQVVTDHFSDVTERKRPELAKVEPFKGKTEGMGNSVPFP